jgi:hypothetical protein
LSVGQKASETPLVSVIGGVYLSNGFRSAGAVRLPGAEIKGQLQMGRAQLNGTDQDGNALFADGATVGGDVFLSTGFTSAGAVRLSGVEMKVNIEMSGAQLNGTDQDGNALVADLMSRNGRVCLGTGFTSNGTVTLKRARVEGRLNLSEAGHLSRLVLRDTQCSVFADGGSGWPPKGELDLGGFRFGRLDDELSGQQRLDWVKLQDLSYWSKGPYEQLAAFYTRTGDETVARQINIVKNDDELAHLKRTNRWRTLRYRVWRRPFGVLLGYGYRRWVAGWLLVAVMVAAGFAFWALDDAMVPNTSAAELAQPCGAAYPCFNPLIYGADVVLPIIDLGHEAEWRPDTKSSEGELAENLRWASLPSAGYSAPSSSRHSPT